MVFSLLGQRPDRTHGQASLFIIIGLIILLIVTLVFVFKTPTKSSMAESESIAADVLPIQEYIERCLHDQLRFLIMVAAFQGGYVGVVDDPIEYDLPEQRLPLSVPYYLKEGVKNNPLKEKVEQELSNALQHTASRCTKVPSLPYPLSVDEEKITSVVTLAENKVDATINIPITIQFETATKGVSNFLVSIPTQFTKLHSVANTLTNVQQQNGNMICLSCITEMVNDDDLESKQLNTRVRIILSLFTRCTR